MIYVYVHELRKIMFVIIESETLSLCAKEEILGKNYHSLNKFQRAEKACASPEIFTARRDIEMRVYSPLTHLLLLATISVKPSILVR